VEAARQDLRPREAARRRGARERKAAIVGAAGAGPARRANPAGAADKSFDAEALANIAADGIDTSPVTSVLAAIVEPIARRTAPSLERYGLTNRDRIGPKSNSPLYEPKQRIAEIFGIELQVFEHDVAEPAIAIEPFEEPAVLLSHAIGGLPLAQQVFVLGYAATQIAMRLHAALALHPAELELTLVGAVRTVAPVFSLRPNQGEDVEEVKEVVRKHHHRRYRKQLETAAGEIAAGPRVDLAAWRRSAEQTAIRAGALLADDLVASLDALRFVVDLPLVRGRALVEQSPVVRDLLRFWVSNRAATVRAQSGILGGGRGDDD
jgi:hypothetical protein